MSAEEEILGKKKLIMMGLAQAGKTTIRRAVISGLTGDELERYDATIDYERETKRIAGAARMSRMLVAPHNPAGPVSTAATAQVISTVTNFLILEYAWGEVDWRAGLLEPPERIEEGYLVLPEGPGLGHLLNHEVLERYRRACTRDADSSKIVPS